MASAILKAVNIPAFSNEIEMYVLSYFPDSLLSLSGVAAVSICLFEILFGGLLLFAKNQKLTSLLVCLMFAFFTYLTSINLFCPPITGSVESCGCFGELIHMTPTMSFIKAVVLLILAILLCIANFKRANNIRCLAKAAKMFFVTFLLSLYSCSADNTTANYTIADDTEVTKIPLLGWNIFVSYKGTKVDSIHHHEGLYKPLYGQVDLKEVYGLQPEDTTCILKGQYTKLKCNISSNRPRQLYLEVKNAMPLYICLNGDTLVRRDIQGLNIYPLKLNVGDNSLSIKAETSVDDLSLETTLYDSLSIARLYTEWQSSNIAYALIFPETKSIMITNAHQNVLNTPVRIKLQDITGNVIGDTILTKESMVYMFPKLETNKSYMCSMTMEGITIRQPLWCGNGDDAYNIFKAKRKSLSDSEPRAKEIDGLLYRLNFLLNHPTRHDGDWWWQFKISPLTYQLEYTFAHLNENFGHDDMEPSIKFVTYTSKIDGKNQRYILATPDNVVKHGMALPMVVVIRPDIEKYHPFFSSPQLARQWAVNQMQAMANRYRCIIMMPEMRTYLNEDITPKSEKELLLAIEDVKAHYRIDSKRIFLHANCSGGYRALRIVEDMPEKFAAIGMYAPLYDKSFKSKWSMSKRPKLYIKKLKGKPLFIHYDPLDTHSPYKLFEKLIKDCNKYNIPLTVSVKRNSGKFYNVNLVGEEAMEFFSGI